MRIWLEIVGNSNGVTNSSLLLCFDKRRFLFNCDEGIHRLSKEYKLGFSKLKGIFLTQITQTQISGLGNLLFSLGIQSSKKNTNMHIYGPQHTIPMATSLCEVTSHRGHKLIIHEQLKSDIILQEKLFRIRSIVLRDRKMENYKDNNKENENSTINQTQKVCTLDLENSSKNLQAKSIENIQNKDRKSLIYIVQFNQLKGRFNSEKAKQLGLTENRDIKIIYRGENVTLKNGNIIKPTDVIGPKIDVPPFAIIDIPEHSFLNELIECKEFDPFIRTKENKQIVKEFSSMFYWINNEILLDDRFREWIIKFGPKTKHIFLNKQNEFQLPTNISFRSSFFYRNKLNLIDSKLFPINKKHLIDFEEEKTINEKKVLTKNNNNNENENGNENENVKIYKNKNKNKDENENENKNKNKKQYVSENKGLVEEEEEEGEKEMIDLNKKKAFQLEEKNEQENENKNETQKEQEKKGKKQKTKKTNSGIEKNNERAMEITKTLQQEIKNWHKVNQLDDENENSKKKKIKLPTESYFGKNQMRFYFIPIKQFGFDFTQVIKMEHQYEIQKNGLAALKIFLNDYENVKKNEITNEKKVLTENNKNNENENENVKIYKNKNYKKNENENENKNKKQYESENKDLMEEKKEKGEEEEERCNKVVINKINENNNNTYFNNEKNKNNFQKNNTKQLEKLFQEIVFLGTGSGVPSTIRNVSGIFIRITKKFNILLDCGEGSYGQLLTFYGDKIKKHLQNLKFIWISHLHADHHLGLMKMLKMRETLYLNQFGSLDDYKSPLVIGPAIIRKFINSINRITNELTIFEMYDHEILNNFKKIINNDQNFTILKKFQQIIQVPMLHANHSYGIVLIRNDMKLVYSGDGMPTKELISAGMNSQILIHESTFNESNQQLALKYNHSTIKEALEVSKNMNAKWLILTHFSPRYQKKDFSQFLKENIGLAFDLISITPKSITRVDKISQTLHQLLNDF
ncbi:zinc phosphodiesterase elac protein [Anaeramoeba flamelloides]|uniref:ribonuclease Z n=1 Tax=Anaeramoeba flamelloides TaxID=1746091 RepID=A0AAV7ZZL8_9EUKA|nr:zinc phosphodiesterase elac protein [Anaeramoeba flamelloides]